MTRWPASCCADISASTCRSAPAAACCAAVGTAASPCTSCAALAALLVLPLAGLDGTTVGPGVLPPVAGLLAPGGLLGPLAPPDELQPAMASAAAAIAVHQSRSVRNAVNLRGPARRLPSTG